MTDETPTPEVTPAPQRRKLPMPAISGRRKVLAIGLTIAACIYLLTLKHGVMSEQETRDVAKKLVIQQRDQINEDMVRAFKKSYRGESRNKEQVALVERVGSTIVAQSDAKESRLKLKFHLLAEPDSINVFGLSSGDIYITTSMLNRMQTEGQLAAALAHGIAHAMVGDMLTPVPAGKHPLPIWQHSAEQERAADILGLRLMAQTGYDPNAMASMLTILAKAYNSGSDVAFFTTHPNAADRMTALDTIIKQMYPTGMPTVMSK